MIRLQNDLESGGHASGNDTNIGEGPSKTTQIVANCLIKETQEQNDNTPR